MRRIGFHGGAVVVAMTGLAVAEPSSVEAEHEPLQARIDALDARLARVETRKGGSWLTEQRAEEIKGLVSEVLADADARTSLLEDGLTSGYEEGFVIGSADGNWLLRMNYLQQTRFVFNTQTMPPAGTNDTAWGFEVTRATFALSGHVVSPDWFYYVEIALGSNDEGAEIRGDDRAGRGQTHVGYDFGNGLKLYGGTIKPPLLFDELVEVSLHQAVERAYVTYLYTGARSDGIVLDYRGEQFHVALSYNNGISDGLYGGSVPAGPSTALVADTDYAVTARGEWLIAGSWEQMEDYTSPGGERVGALLGAAIHSQRGQRDAGSVDLLVLTIDGTVEFGGGNVYAAFTYSGGDPPGAPTIDSLALLIGGGVYLTEDWELFGRFEWSDLDGAALLAGLSSEDDQAILTVGATKYFSGHNLKWTTDVGIGLNPVLFNVPVTEFREDEPGEDGQVVVRSQFQILF